jgi:ABC-2 type transport system ATP-binding protein
MRALTLQGVERRYRNGRGAGPCDLAVDSGERVALMGPNGAGKSTLLGIAATALRPGRGRVEWQGTRSRRTARRLLGYAPDEGGEAETLTGRQSAHFWCRQWLGRDAARRNVTAALRAFDLDAVADEPIARYSFGMRRRLALVHALAHDPRIALLDEPSAGLDPEGVSALRAAMEERSVRGRTTVVATNDCAFAAAAAQRVVFLHGGLIVRDASPRDLLAESATPPRAELAIAGEPDLASLGRVQGVGSVVRHNGTVTVELLERGALAPLVAAADSPGGRLRALTLRDADLSDAFRSLTGAELLERR